MDYPASTVAVSLRMRVPSIAGELVGRVLCVDVVFKVKVRCGEMGYDDFKPRWGLF